MNGDCARTAFFRHINRGGAHRASLQHGPFLDESTLQWNSDHGAVMPISRLNHGSHGRQLTLSEEHPLARVYLDSDPMLHNL